MMDVGLIAVVLAFFAGSAGIVLLLDALREGER